MRTAIFSSLLAGLLAFAPAWAESLPSIHDVYAAAKAGQLDQARGMVDKVLAAKPDSAKAHFVKAEICASQADIGCVRTELGTAKKIDAGLAFANPAAVAKLEKIASTGNVAQPVSSSGHAGFPWGWLLIGLGVVALLWWVISIANRRAAQNVYPAYGSDPVYGGNPMQPGGPGYGNPMQPGYGAPMQNGGLGSTIGRGLVTGAALGAGMVAGEALADSLLHRGGQSAPAWDPGADAPAPDLGGNDFGIGGADSWDSSGGGLDSLGSDGDW